MIEIIKGFNLFWGWVWEKRGYAHLRAWRNRFSIFRNNFRGEQRAIETLGGFPMDIKTKIRYLIICA